MATATISYASVSSRKRRIVLEGYKISFIGLFESNGKGWLNAPAHSRSRRSGHCPCAASNDLLTCTAIPDADCLTLHAILNEHNDFTCQRLCVLAILSEKLCACLATERAGVSCMLCDFHLAGANTSQFSLNMIIFATTVPS